MHRRETVREDVQIPLVLALMSPLAVVAAYPVAGLEPDRRPEAAPVITEVAKQEDWYRRALSGIEPPPLPRLRFLEDQGGWYSPFNHPGMTGRYDIRGWHGK
ncbi:MAG: hypothetical protein LJE70_13940 [Chromatiaceae bacterium]|jgi:hypothetical protein|nr:hypothetical protein [Chromatiaceae bacterium]